MGPPENENFLGYKRGCYVPQGLSPSAVGHRLLLAILLVLVVGCSRPASFEQFIRVADAPGGLYRFELELPDSTATYDISFYTADLKESLQLEVRWNDDSGPLLNENVWIPADRHVALYRSGLRQAPGKLCLRVRTINPPKHFRGLGIIMHQNDGTR